MWRGPDEYFLPFCVQLTTNMKGIMNWTSVIVTGLLFSCGIGLAETNGMELRSLQPPVPLMTHDFPGAAVKTDALMPGPFADWPLNGCRIDLNGEKMKIHLSRKDSETLKSLPPRHKDTKTNAGRNQE